MKNNDSIYDALAPLCDCIMHIEESETDYEKQYRKEVFETVTKNLDGFFKQVDKKIKDCENNDERSFVYDTTMNFLVFSINRMMDRIPSENIPSAIDALEDLLLKIRNFHGKKETQKENR